MEGLNENSCWVFSKQFHLTSILQTYTKVYINGVFQKLKLLYLVLSHLQILYKASLVSNFGQSKFKKISGKNNSEKACIFEYNMYYITGLEHFAEALLETFTLLGLFRHTIGERH